MTDRNLTQQAIDAEAPAAAYLARAADADRQAANDILWSDEERELFTRLADMFRGKAKHMGGES